MAFRFETANERWQWYKTSDQLPMYLGPEWELQEQERELQAEREREAQRKWEKAEEEFDRIEWQEGQRRRGLPASYWDWEEEKKIRRQDYLELQRYWELEKLRSENGTRY